MDRRSYLKAGAGATVFTLAGCLGGGSGGESSGEATESDGDGTEAGGEETTAAETESIVIGSDIPYKPFEYRTNDDELVGFDVEIAEAVFGQQLDYDHEFKQTAFDTIIPSLNNGNFRVIMSAMTITESRAEQVDFSDPYFTAYQTIVVLQNSDITAKEDLRGANVGVQKGTTGEKAAEDLKAEFDGDLTLKRFDQIPDAFSALINNQVSAVINDNTVSAEFVNENSDKVRFVEGDGQAAEDGADTPSYLTLSEEEYGIAFRKDDDELRNEVNEALAAIREDGTYDEIYNKYFQG